MEHRWGYRFTTAVEVRIAGCPSWLSRGMLRDASISGGYIETGLSLPLWTSVQIEIVSEAGAAPEKLAACVARQDERGIGLEWLDLAPEIILRLLPPRLTRWREMASSLARSA